MPPSLHHRLGAAERSLAEADRARELDPESGIYQALDGLGWIPEGPYDGEALIDRLFDALDGPDDYDTSTP